MLDHEPECGTIECNPTTFTVVVRTPTSLSEKQNGERWNRYDGQLLKRLSEIGRHSPQEKQCDREQYHPGHNENVSEAREVALHPDSAVFGRLACEDPGDDNRQQEKRQQCREAHRKRFRECEWIE